jgi:prepilin-type N-terminal cleavage/methylation domain-containing protein
MSKLWRSKYLKAFTLIELLVVIAIIAILAAILIPAVSDALLRGHMTKIMSNGKNIYVALFAQEMSDAVLLRGVPYPQGSTYDNSTTYFTWVGTSGVMNVSGSFFAAPGVSAEDDWTKFTATNNAWCITRDIQDSTVDGTPVLFTRNLIGANLMKSNTLSTTINPFGNKGVVAVLKGGSAVALRAKDIAENFNKVNATNVILRPTADGTGY